MTQIALEVHAPGKPRLDADDTTVLSSANESCLVGIVEVAHSILRRHQFFLWARGVLQSLVPHEILLCGYGDWRRRKFIVDKFARRPFPEPMYDEFCETQNGLMAQASAIWEANGHAPLVVCPYDPRYATHSQFNALLIRHNLVNCVFHGVPQVYGNSSVFFCLINLPVLLSRRTSYLIDLVTPSLYAAHLRVLHEKRRRGDRRVPREPVRPRAVLLSRKITGREVQILQWVQEGKSNREIGEVLKISPLTVKNHMQNIRKKLKVRNRAQAVSRAIGARLI